MNVGSYTSAMAPRRAAALRDQGDVATTLSDHLVAATDALLDVTPLGTLTTRQIARGARRIGWRPVQPLPGQAGADPGGPAQALRTARRPVRAGPARGGEGEHRVEPAGLRARAVRAGGGRAAPRRRAPRGPAAARALLDRDPSPAVRHRTATAAARRLPHRRARARPRQRVDRYRGGHDARLRRQRDGRPVEAAERPRRSIGPGRATRRGDRDDRQRDRVGAVSPTATAGDDSPSRRDRRIPRRSAGARSRRATRGLDPCPDSSDSRRCRPRSPRRGRPERLGQPVTWNCSSISASSVSSSVM